MQNKPSVFDFLDVAQYLQTHYEWRKKQDPKFSLGTWSQELGMGSKVTLRFILKRMRRISPRSATVFKSHLFTSDNERGCFDALVAYSQAKTASERQVFGSSLLHWHKKRMVYTEVESPVLQQSVFGPLVLTLLTFHGFKKTAESISNLLKVDVSCIQEILLQFEKENLITKNPESEFEMSAEIFKVPDNPHLKKFYEYWIDRSKAALDLPRETRKYRALNFALTKEEYEQALEKMNEYALNLLTKFNHSSLAGRRLYMLESCLFPVSEEVV